MGSKSFLVEFGMLNFESGILNGSSNFYSIFNILNSIFLFMIGASVGSFLNVLIDRLPKGESILGRSHCDYCKKPLSSRELIPVLSFLIQGGKSRCCGKKLSFQYPLVEMITGIVFVSTAVIPSEARNLATEGSVKLFNYASLDPSGFALRMTMWGIISCLIIIFFSDLKFQMIPDSIQVIFLIFVLLFHLITDYRLPITNYLLSGFLVMSPILFLFLITLGRGMGFGDVKLAFIIGFMLGTKGGLIALYLAFIIGAIVGAILLLAKKKDLKSKVAFGPFLVLGTLIIFFWQDKILEIIKKIYGL